MAVSVKKAVLWRRELENRPGTLADALRPFADGKVNLQVVMGYVMPGGKAQAALEVYPVTGKKAENAAKAAGMEPMSGTSALVVEGDDQVGLGYRMASALATDNVNINFAIIQVIGKSFTGVFGFATSDLADKALKLIKAASAAARKKPAAKKKAGARGPKKAAPKRKSAVKKAVTKRKAATKRKSVAKPAAKKSKPKAKPKAKPAARKTAKKPVRRAKKK